MEQSVALPRVELERMYALASEIRSRAQDDPLLNFEPHLKQREFIDRVLSGECRTNLALWANRVGKSEAGAYLDAHLARFGDPNAKPDSYGRVQVTDRATSGWIVSLDFPASRDILQPKIFDNGFVPPGQPHPPFVPKREIKDWSAGNQVLRLHNGSILGFKSAESGRDKFQGTGKDYIHFDEEPPEDVFDEATIRIEAGRRLRVFVTATLLPPDGEAGGVTWMYPRFVKPWRHGRAIGFWISTASMYDNPHLPVEEIRYQEAKYPLGSKVRRIRVDGELLAGIGGSLAYGNFDYERHVIEQPTLNQYRPLVWCWDFNYNPLVTLIGQRDGRLFRFHDEILIRDGASIDAMCEAFYESYNGHRGGIWIYGDQTGEGHNVQTAKTNYTLIMNCMRTHNVHPKLKLPSRNPFVSDRVNAFNFQLIDDHGESHVEIDPRCTELIADLEEVQRDHRSGIRKSHNAKDPYYGRTHASDAAGYWLVYEEPVRSASERREGAGRPIRNPGYNFGKH